WIVGMWQDNSLAGDRRLRARTEGTGGAIGEGARRWAHLHRPGATRHRVRPSGGRVVPPPGRKGKRGLRALARRAARGYRKRAVGDGRVELACAAHATRALRWRAAARGARKGARARAGPAAARRALLLARRYAAGHSA